MPGFDSLVVGWASAADRAGHFYQLWDVKLVPPSEAKLEGAYWIIAICNAGYLEVTGGLVAWLV